VILDIAFICNPALSRGWPGNPLFTAGCILFAHGFAGAKFMFRALSEAGVNLFL
jgi:hypothetical protein